MQKQVVEELLLVCKTFGTAMVLVMKNGETVEYGKTQQVLENPQADYTRALLSAVPRLRRA